MASAKNDALVERTVEGSLNYYDKHRAKGTAMEKGLAARLGGHTYNILSGQDREEIYFRHLRNDDHFVDRNNRHNAHFFGPRKRPFAPDERGLIEGCFKAPEAHPREEQASDRRTAVQLAQMENSTSWKGFQERYHSDLFPPTPRKRYSINNKLYANEAGKVASKVASKDSWKSRRGETLAQSSSCPNIRVGDSHVSLHQAMQADTRKEVSQRQTESAHFAPWASANTYAHSLESTGLGRQHAAAQPYCSVSRLENHDFAITRKNNHYSSADKLTRSDGMYMRPKLATTNNSVKYDIISNERKWFKYG